MTIGRLVVLMRSPWRNGAIDSDPSTVAFARAIDDGRTSQLRTPNLKTTTASLKLCEEKFPAWIRKHLRWVETLRPQLRLLTISGVATRSHNPRAQEGNRITEIGPCPRQSVACRHEPGDSPIDHRESSMASDKRTEVNSRVRAASSAASNVTCVRNAKPTGNPIESRAHSVPAPESEGVPILLDPRPPEATPRRSHFGFYGRRVLAETRAVQACFPVQRGARAAQVARDLGGVERRVLIIAFDPTACRVEDGFQQQTCLGIRRAG